MSSPHESEMSDGDRERVDVAEWLTNYLFFSAEGDAVPAERVIAAGKRQGFPFEALRLASVDMGCVLDSDGWRLPDHIMVQMRAVMDHD